MKIRRKIGLALAIASIAAPISALPASAASTLSGSGSTFVWNIIDSCRATYSRSSIANPSTDVVSYSGGGSGTGKRNFSDATATPTVQWAATDSIYSSGAPKSPFVYVPLVAGAISVMYHVEGVQPANAPIQLSPLTIGKIFSGQVTSWNDAAIKADNIATSTKAVTKVTKNGVTVTAKKTGNKVALRLVVTPAGLTKFKGKLVNIVRITKTGAQSVVYGAAVSKAAIKTVVYSSGATYAVKVGKTSLGSVTVDNTVVGTTLTLPATPIRVYYRSDTSGTTNNFTKFLNLTVGSIWTNSANDAFTTAFPGTITNFAHILSAAGSDGVSNNVRDNNGGITYTELSYVEERKNATKGIGSASVKNNAGMYVAPSATSTGSFYAEAPVDAAGVITPDYTVKAADAYLINAVAYGLGYTASSTVNAGVRSWFTYLVGTCAPATAAAAFYAPLSGAFKDKALAQAAKVGAS